MNRAILAAIAALAIAGSTAVYAQHRPWQHRHMRLSAEDRAAFVDARIAAVKAGLKLTPDQEKLWPPVEAAVREFAKLRIDRADARMQARRGGDRHGPDADPLARLHRRADTLAATASALQKIADAADPLYRTLDEGQKRRLTMPTRMEHRLGGDEWRDHRHRGSEHDLGRDHDRDRAMPGMGPNQDSGRL